MRSAKLLLFWSVNICGRLAVLKPTASLKAACSGVDGDGELTLSIGHVLRAAARHQHFSAVHSSVSQIGQWLDQRRDTLRRRPQRQPRHQRRAVRGGCSAHPHSPGFVFATPALYQVSFACSGCLASSVPGLLLMKPASASRTYMLDFMRARPSSCWSSSRSPSWPAYKLETLSR